MKTLTIHFTNQKTILEIQGEPNDIVDAAIQQKPFVKLKFGNDTVIVNVNNITYINVK